MKRVFFCSLFLVCSLISDGRIVVDIIAYLLFKCIGKKIFIYSLMVENFSYKVINTFF